MGGLYRLRRRDVGVHILGVANLVLLGLILKWTLLLVGELGPPRAGQLGQFPKGALR